ncbi:MAG: DUF2283 domain-containing protein [Candidatus Micrarchaeota archaeon]|nr:DUF2283 domain-containing protein [Candidatus Micrarchaeota archaeon]MDE1824628.1 DUF2283 domain-containing protein [Candidatus Micrarchaeota archaeon]MDE1849715.1 DUF2283 domain-containing protein [Candidatus Micrarchaeota archaeon]
MEKTRIIFNKKGNTLDIWLDDPKKESISEETDSEVILKKDKKGRIIGIEKLNFVHDKAHSKESAEMPLELVVE